MAGDSSTLMVKHLPPELSQEEEEELLRHFGATAVRAMGNKGRMRHTAFATFSDHEAASKALHRLHQMEVLGQRLNVEFSTSENAKNHPSVIETFKKPTITIKDKAEPKEPVVTVEEIDMKKVANGVNSLARDWDIKYSMDPRLEYMYPHPTVNILTNIANALASVPKFYVQVLHLMNKMNLPTPFGMVTPTPVLPEGKTSDTSSNKNRSTTLAIADLKESYENRDTSEESEIESDGEANKLTDGPQPKLKLKRKKGSGIEPRKRLKLVQNLPEAPKSKAPVVKPADVFEQPDVSVSKKIAFNLSRFEEDTPSTKTNGIAPPEPATNESLESKNQESEKHTLIEPLPGAPPLPPPENEEENMETESVQMVSEDIDSLYPSIPQPPPPLPPEPKENQESLKESEENVPVVEEGGFGTFAPAPKTDANEDEDSGEEEWGEREFISSKALRKGRISSSEKREYSVFKKYEKGEPSSRLYIKNIAKPVTEKDIHYIYGRYVDWNNETHKNMFDIRLMKEGRMKGQAFVTLPSNERAEEALNDTHGFMLQGKPIVVQFARSAKAKETDEKSEKSKNKKAK